MKISYIDGIEIHRLKTLPNSFVEVTKPPETQTSKAKPKNASTSEYKFHKCWKSMCSQRLRYTLAGFLNVILAWYLNAAMSIM